MKKFHYKCRLHGRLYEGTIEAEDSLRAREELLKKYDKVEQLWIL
jgi:hypothetical protein